MKYEHVMLDLETMGNGPNAAITAVGAVAFDLEAGELGPEFYQIVDLESSVREGGVMDASTVLWWMKQSDEARAIYLEKGNDIATVLLWFSLWFKDAVPGKYVWGNGAAFDNVILASAYRRLRTPQPWHHWNDRCYRTVKAWYPNMKMEKSGTAHNALDDAKNQARHLINMIGGTCENK